MLSRAYQVQGAVSMRVCLGTFEKQHPLATKMTMNSPINIILNKDSKIGDELDIRFDEVAKAIKQA